MNISNAAEQTGLTAKTIRYYEDIELVVADRRANGYRDYADSHLQRLTFLKRARSLGFTVEDCRKLLRLYQDDHRNSADVKRLAIERLADLAEKEREIKQFRKTLTELVESCPGDDGSDCPIISRLAGESEE
ncbi:MAG: Cu(I)-responsive transcriptional regulator [Hyphomicrobiaceae bacterium]